MARRRKRPVSFLRLAKHRQKEAYVRIRNLIRRAAPVLGGLFYTHDYLHGRNGWVDGYFLSPRPPVFYNFSLETTRHAYKEAAWDAAWERSCVLAPDRAPELLKHAVKDPKTGNYSVQQSQQTVHPELDGLTRVEWARNQLRVIADAKTIRVFEGWSLHREYVHGVGLHATIDVDYLTTETVNAFIARFLATEAGYRSTVALSYGYDDIPEWEIEANALLEPWEYPQVTLSETIS